MSQHYPLVLVAWVDSYGVGSSWRDIGGDEISDTQPLRCRSVGYLVHDHDSAIVIVPHLALPHPGLSRPNGDEATVDGCGDITIPRNAVERIMYLQAREDSA